MKRLILVLLMAGLVGGAALAGGWTVTYSLAGGTVGLTNTQANSSWVPVSVLLKFAAAGGGTVEVARVSQSNTFVLATCVFTNAASVVWVPDAGYPFGLGEALVVRSSVTNGMLQVIRKGE
jgi:hypothetical protein